MHKHVYTCPDVIHLKARYRRTMLINFSIVAAIVAGLWVIGTMHERKTKQELHIDI
jgi:hypothetical protein